MMETTIVLGGVALTVVIIVILGVSLIFVVWTAEKILK
jgi:hypothetical protein